MFVKTDAKSFLKKQVMRDIRRIRSTEIDEQGADWNQVPDNLLPTYKSIKRCAKNLHNMNADERKQVCSELAESDPLTLKSILRFENASRIRPSQRK